MYGLPPNVDLSFFQRRILIQVCFGAHDLILSLDGHTTLSISSCVGCADPSGNIQKHTAFSDAAPVLLKLLNCSIANAAGDESGTLSLRFTNGIVVAAYDDSDVFESYTIRNGDQLIVV